jgi:two-component system CitB family sensor kinase
MRRTSLGVQLLVMQVVIVLGTVLVAGALAVRLEEQQIRSTYARRVLTIARSLSHVPSVSEAYASTDPAHTLQPLAETVQQAAGATFVVFTNDKGIRYSHPEPDKIGKMVSTDPSVPLSGEEFVGTETGTLGRSLRAKVPVRDHTGRVIGTVSVGILEARLSHDLANVVPALAAWLTAAAMLGVVGAAVVTRLVRRRIFGLEPDEIAELLKSRDAMLHGIREGVVALDDRGRIALANDEAMRLLSLDRDPTGQPASEVLDTEIMQVLVSDDDPVTDRIVLAGERLLVANRSTAKVGTRDVGQLLTLRDRTELFDALRALQGQRSVTDALRAQAHEFSNNLHVLSGLIELGRHDDAVRFIARLGASGNLVGGATLRHVEDSFVAALLVAKGAAAAERGVTLVLDDESHVADGVGDDVVTVVGNLIDNAVDAAGLGGTVTVHVAYAGPAHPVTMRVEDDGPGVPVEQRQRLFAGGFSSKTATDGADEHHGHGIGLALVARIARRRHGTVDVDEREGGGAVFTVTLPPLVPAPAAAGSDGGVPR